MLWIKCLGSVFRGFLTWSPLASSSDSRDYHVQAEAGGAILRSVSSVNLSLKFELSLIPEKSLLPALGDNGGCQTTYDT